MKLGFVVARVTSTNTDYLTRGGLWTPLLRCAWIVMDDEARPIAASMKPQGVLLPVYGKWGHPEAWTTECGEEA